MIYILDNICTAHFYLSLHDSHYPRNTLKISANYSHLFRCFSFYFLSELVIVTAFYWTRTTQMVTPGRVYSVGWTSPKEGILGPH